MWRENLLWTNMKLFETLVQKLIQWKRERKWAKDRERERERVKWRMVITVNSSLWQTLYPCLLTNNHETSFVLSKLGWRHEEREEGNKKQREERGESSRYSQIVLIFPVLILWKELASDSAQLQSFAFKGNTKTSVITLIVLIQFHNELREGRGSQEREREGENNHHQATRGSTWLEVNPFQMQSQFFSPSLLFSLSIPLSLLFLSLSLLVILCHSDWTRVRERNLKFESKNLQYSTRKESSLFLRPLFC